jgi:stage II sporulation protein D
MRLAILTAALLALLPAAQAQAADLVVQGHGWGHGVGLSQYGAYGYALREAHDHRFILAHYYTGSGYGTAPGARMRVRLKRARAPRIGGATRARAANGRRIGLSEARVYRFRARSGNRIDVVVNGRRRARLLAPVTVSGGASTTLHGTADNGLVNGAYRGRMVLVRDGGAVLAVNSIGLEQYLYGVVPSEMPASWPAEALKAQAVVARSYALRSRRPGAVYDVFSDTRSQVYRGVPAETVATNAAVQGTNARVVTAGGQIAQTFFFSTSGGRTADNEEAFGGTAISYLRSVDDPYDDLSPYHDWTARFTAAEARRKLRSVTVGRLQGLKVAGRTPSGRAATVTVQGSGGDRTVSAVTVRDLLSLRSTWIAKATGP